MKVKLLLCILAFLMVLPAIVSAVCPAGSPYCVDSSPDAVTYDARNGTFLHFWLDTSLTDLPVANYVWSLILPLWNFFGYWLIAILWFTFLVAVWLRAMDVEYILIVGGVSGSVLVAFFPWEAKIVGTIILAICFAVLSVRALYGTTS